MHPQCRQQCILNSDVNGGSDWIAHYPQSIFSCRSHFNMRCKLSLSPSHSSSFPFAAAGLVQKWTPHLKLPVELCTSRGTFIPPDDINGSLDYLKVIGKREEEKGQSQIEHKTADEIRRWKRPVPLSLSLSWVISTEIWITGTDLKR